MKWMKTTTVMLALSSLLCATVSLAQPNLAGDLHRGSKLIGADVENPQGEDLGDIKDLVFDSQGRVMYAVLAFGGFLGMGEKYFAVPWAALKPEIGQKPGDRERYVLNMDKERLQNAPGFDKNNWPNMADRSWAEQIHAFYSVPPYWEQREARVVAPTAGTAGMPPAAMVTATVQRVDKETKLLQMRTTNDEIVELQAPTGLLGRLQDGDRVEVVIRKQESAAPPPGQPAR
jgi:sporulation protein YlmC with PRC-barrel domain